MMKRALLAVVLLWSVCTASQAQDRAACERIVRLVAEAVGAGSIGEIEPFLAPGFIFSGQEGDRARAVMKLLVAQLDERVERIETVRQERTEEGLELVCAFTYAGRLGRKEATFLFDGEGRLKRLELLPIRVRTLGDKGGTFARPAARQLDIPVRRLGNLLTATALLDGRERTFILDNGAPRLMLNSRRCVPVRDTAALRISSSKGVNASIAGMDIVTISGFDFHGIRAGGGEFLCFDMSHLEDGTEVFGLLGYEVYKDYDLLFDYGAGMLTLLDPAVTDSCVRRLACGRPVTEVPVRMEGHVACVEARIGTHTLRLGIDCGAGTDLLDDGLWDSLRSDLARRRETTLTGADAEVRRVRSGRVKRLTIGDREFRRVPTVFNDMSHLNLSLGHGLDGLIGFPVLSAQRTVLSYRSGRLIFLP